MLKKPCYFPKSGLQLFYLQIIHVEAAAAPDRLRMSLSDHDWCAVLWGGCTSKMAGLGPYRDTIWQTIKGKPKEMIRSMFMDVPGVFFFVSCYCNFTGQSSFVPVDPKNASDNGFSNVPCCVQEKRPSDLRSPCLDQGNHAWFVISSLSEDWNPGRTTEWLSLTRVRAAQAPDSEIAPSILKLRDAMCIVPLWFEHQPTDFCFTKLELQ